MLLQKKNEGGDDHFFFYPPNIPCSYVSAIFVPISKFKSKQQDSRCDKRHIRGGINLQDYHLDKHIFMLSSRIVKIPLSKIKFHN